MTATFDTSRWPLVVIRYGPHMDEEASHHLYTTWDALLARGPHATLIDLRATNPLLLSAKVRKTAADAVEARRPIFEKQLVAEARCVSSAIMRNVVTAFDWMVGNTFARPLKNFSNYAESEAWLEAELQKRGLRIAGASQSIPSR